MTSTRLKLTTFQLVAQYLTIYATACPQQVTKLYKISNTAASDLLEWWKVMSMCKHC
jgi:hypothetical protein